MKNKDFAGIAHTESKANHNALRTLRKNGRVYPHPETPSTQTRYPNNVATSATSDHLTATAETTPSLLADYATLFKLRISTMVIITAGAGFYLGSLRSGISPFHAGLIQALAGITVVTLGSSALNQALERKTDRLMRRTADRPMAAGRISLAHGLILGFAAVFLGSLYLSYTTNLLTGTLTLLTAIGYVAIYTPLKRITTINTFIGAFPGALPPLIGWTAARGLIEWPGVALFAILFLWQFPHFMAIGWMYREDYAARRHPPHPHPHRRPLRRPLHRHPGPLLRAAHDPRQPLALRPRHRRIPLRRRRHHPQPRLPLVHHPLRPHHPQPRVT